MAEETSNNKFNKYIAVALAVVIIVAIGIYAYTTFIKKELTPSKNENDQTPNTQPKETLLTINVGSQSYNYTLNNLTALGTISEYGSYINRLNKTTGPNNYTGVSISVLLNSLPALPDNFNMLQAIASDGYFVNYTIDKVNGHVTIYNETGHEIGTGNLTMIIAYKENGVLLNETTKGPLRIAFVDTQPTITNSGLWLGSLVKIKII
jgi:hypothetical protein